MSNINQLQIKHSPLTHYLSHSLGDRSSATPKCRSNVVRVDETVISCWMLACKWPRRWTDGKAGTTRGGRFSSSSEMKIVHLSGVFWSIKITVIDFTSSLHLFLVHRSTVPFCIVFHRLLRLSHEECRWHCFYSFLLHLSSHPISEHLFMSGHRFWINNKF